MPDGAAGETSGAARLGRLGGVAALLGGLAWTLKGVVILAGGDQPPLLFEVAPPLFGIGLLGVAYSTMPSSRRRRAVLGLAALAAVAGVVALVSDLVSEVWGAALAISSVALLVGLLMLARVRRWPAPLAWWIGVALLPSLLLGGALAEIDERLLEIPLTVVGTAWMALGGAALRQEVLSSSTR